MYNIYLVTYQEIDNNENEHTIIAVDEIVEDISPNICQQIYEDKYPEEKYQGELSIITMQKLYSTDDAKQFLIIKGEIK